MNKRYGVKITRTVTPFHVVSETVYVQAASGADAVTKVQIDGREKTPSEMLFRVDDVFVDE